MRTLPNMKDVLILVTLSIIGVSYAQFQEQRDTYAMGNGQVEEQVSNDVKNLRVDIEGLHRDINEAKGKLNQGVTVSALVLSNNPEELKEIRNKLKVEMDILNAEIHPGLKPTPESTNVSRKILKGVLEGKESVFYRCFNTKEKANFAMAIAGQESGYGTSDLARNNYNFYGIYLKGKWAKFNTIEEGICKGAKANIGKYIRDFAESDQSFESYIKAMKGYCVTGCSSHKNIYKIYKSL